MEKLNKKELTSRINPWLLTKLETPNEAVIEKFHPIEIISSTRLDVLIKYTYLKYKNTTIKDTWSENIYREHIENFNKGIEGDISGKDNIDKFVESFKKLYLDIRENGFSSSTSLIPIDKNGNIIDGSHRLAICLALNQEVYCIRFDINANIYDYKYFIGNGLDENILEQAILEYIRLKQNTYIISLFPATKHKKIEKTINEINKYATIIYEKDIRLSIKGMQNFVIQLYKGEKWLGTSEDNHHGAFISAKERAGDESYTKLVFIECNDFQNLKILKERIRKIYSIGNNSIHINDTYEETLRISEQVLNKNAEFLFNNLDISFDIRFISELEKFKNILKILNLNKDNFVIDGSATLSILGLRKANDLDSLNIMDDTSELCEHDFNSHNYQIQYYNKTLDELIYNPENYFYFNGLKFTNPELISEMKNSRGENKDITDVQLINTLLQKKNNSNNIILINDNKFKKKHLENLIVDNFPDFTVSIIRYFFHKSRSLKSNIKRFVLLALPRHILLPYKGFCIYINRDNSLLPQVKKNKTYEPQLTAAIYSEVSFLNKKSLNVIDIGANVGFLSLNILNQFPNSTIIAFEPGSYQRKLFCKTIEHNKLNEVISLQPYALADFNGVAEFKIHNCKHNSGDGFLDTKRAGSVKTQVVEVTTLDSFLEKAEISHIDIIKIDTEGAELLVLKGALNTLKQMKPIIFFELHKDNIKPYPYTENDLIEFLSKHNYQIKSVYQEIVTAENINRIMAKTEDFIAYPLPH